METLSQAIMRLQTPLPKGLPISRTGRETVRVPGTNVRAAVAYVLTEKEIKGFATALTSHRALAFLPNVRYRVLGVEPQGTLDSEGFPVPPRFYAFTIYDYTHNRPFRVYADFPHARRVEVVEMHYQPVPSYEEWEEAVQILRDHPKYGAALRSGEARAYDIYPPADLFFESGAATPRTLLVGIHYLRPRSDPAFALFQVNMIDRTVSMDASLAQTCGVPPTSCTPPNRGTPGSAWIEWPAVNPVWRLYVTRPASSAGTDGSGIDLQTVEYKGKRVFKQANMPILNVKYDDNRCGPYRDWLYTEHCFQAVGTDLAPGIRWCPTPPQTICEARDDSGNFFGVAAYESGDELVLITECAAGWYRYLNEWRFHRDGIIRPRFVYGTTNHYCACYGRWHHGYWRLDFDLNGSSNHVVEELDTPYPDPHPRWDLLHLEAKRFRRYGRRSRWRVRNTLSGEIAEIIPHRLDGNADSYGKGDCWVLLYKQDNQGRTLEMDDSTVRRDSSAWLDAFVNGERIVDQNVVFWYATHFRRTGGEPLGWCTSVGPEIQLNNW